MKSEILLFVALTLHASLAISYSRERPVLELQGPVASVFTPLRDDHTVDEEAIFPYADYLFDNGIQYVSVGIEGSEMFKLNLENVKKVVRAWVDACSRRSSKKFGVIVQVGAVPLPIAKELAQYSASIGVDALVVVPDQLYKPTSTSGLIDYVDIIAATARHIPVFFHHMPLVTGVNVSMPEFVLEATCKISNFGGVWYGDNDLSNALETYSKLEYGQKVIMEVDEILAGSTSLGMCCSSLTIINIFPSLAQDIITAVKDGDFERARELNLILAQGVWAIRSKGNWVPAMKAAMEIVTGMKMGRVALPERSISTGNKERMRQELCDIGLL